MKKAIAASGETPLEYMLRIMRDSNADAKRRDEMARTAAPYVHPRLANVQQSLDAEAVHYIISDEPMTAEEWEAKYCKGSS